uniref:Uncharacterized protein n=1 Tax=Lygus hesperus TaxID=30085 RepID=A0A0A9XBW8_LYGHE
MRVNPVYFAVFFISKAASALWSQQDPSFKDVAGQDHPHLKREDFARYPKRVNDLKGRFYHASPSNEVYLNKAEHVRLRPVSGRLRHSSRKRKFSPSAEGFIEMESQRPEEGASTVKEETKEASSTDTTEVLNNDRQGMVLTTAKPAINEDHDLEAVDEHPTRVFPHLHSRLSKIIDSSAMSSFDMCPADCFDCPSGVETMFICPKCHTHYIIRMNMRESCCGNTERKTVRKEHKHQRDDDRQRQERRWQRQKKQENLQLSRTLRLPKALHLRRALYLRTTSEHP